MDDNTQDTNTQDTNEQTLVNSTDITAPVTTQEAEVITQANSAASEEVPVAEQPTKVEEVVQPVVEVKPEPSVVVEVAKPVITDGISVMGKIHYQNILDYVEKMNPLKPVDAEVGARHQVTLYRTLLAIINNLDDDFNKVFALVLQLVHEDTSGAFSEVNLFRFFETMILPEKDRAAFQRILNLIKLSSDPKSRMVVGKQINFTATLEHAISEDGKNKVLSFFKV
jgi:hypothetical protein